MSYADTPEEKGTNDPSAHKAKANSMRSLPKSIRTVAGAALCVGLIVFLLFAGYAINIYQWYPSGFFDKVNKNLFLIFVGDRPDPKLTASTYDTALIVLNSTVGIIPTGRTGTGEDLSQIGGGLTSFGKDVLVLPYSGQIYAASSADTVRKTNIVVPYNYRKEYIAAANDPANSDYNIAEGFLRYNDIVYFNTGLRQGLLASYTEYHEGKLCVTNTLARLDISPELTSIDQVNAAPDDWTVIYRTRPCLPFKTRLMAMEGHMAGGRIAFSAPSTVFLSSGDFHYDGMRSEGPGIAQDPEAEYGKVLRIDIETGDSTVYSMGNRNMQGLTILPDGTLLAVEHGPKGGDELNRIREGLNYGWPLESYGTTYYGGPIPNSLSFGRHATFEPPIFSWVPSVGASAITNIRGFHEAWDNDLLVGSLRDGSLYRIRMENANPVYAERIEIGSRIRDINQHTDGRIVAWTDNEELIFLEASDAPDVGPRIEKFLLRADLPSRRENKLRIAVARCAECHSFLEKSHTNSPPLGRIFGKDIASTSYAGYSDSLKKIQGKWTSESLAAFLTDPQDFAPGTTMPAAGIQDSQTIESLVDFLEQLEAEF